MSGTLFVGDVHGCADELDLLLRSVQPTRVVLVGDLFTRGPDPRGVWSLIEEWDARAVLGNHDVHVLERWKPKEQLPKRAFRWLRETPHLLAVDDVLVAHAGVDPRRPEQTRRRDALFLETVKQGRRRKPWWKVYDGPQLVVFGHHGRRGLIDRRPHALGLDTACVKGGRLTGYLLEEDRIVDVAARRAWAS